MREDSETISEDLSTLRSVSHAAWRRLTAFPSHKLNFMNGSGDKGYFYTLLTEGSDSHGGIQEAIQNLCDLGTETPYAPKKLECH